MKQLFLAGAALLVLVSSAQAVEYDPRAATVPAQVPMRGQGASCGGFGATIIKWVERAAEDIGIEGPSGNIAAVTNGHFTSAAFAREAVALRVKPKITEAWVAQAHRLGRLGILTPDLMPPDLIVPGSNVSVAIYHLDGPTIHGCFPQLEKLMAGTDARIAAEDNAKLAKREAAEEQQRREALARQQQAQQREADFRAQQEANAKAEAEAAEERAKRKAVEAERQAETDKRLAAEEEERRQKAQKYEAELRAVAKEKAARQEAEQQAAAEKQRVAKEAQDKRDADAAATRKVEEQIAAEEQARRKAAEDAEAAAPNSQVRNAYAMYGLVRYCYEARNGYAVKYINDAELERAETMIKAIVTKGKAAEPGMDTDQLWARANQLMANKPINAEFCASYYAQLSEMSPVPAIRIQKPL